MFGTISEPLGPASLTVDGGTVVTSDIAVLADGTIDVESGGTIDDVGGKTETLDSIEGSDTLGSGVDSVLVDGPGSSWLTVTDLNVDA